MKNKYPQRHQHRSGHKFSLSTPPTQAFLSGALSWTFRLFLCFLDDPSLPLLWVYHLVNPRWDILGLSWWLRQWRIHLQCRRPGFNPWHGKISWRREWQPTPVFLPGEFHGQRSPWGHKELDTTEWLTCTTSQENKRFLILTKLIV